MEMRLALVERLSNGQYYSDESNIIWKSSDRQNTSGDKKFWKKSNLTYNISKSWYAYFFKINNINPFYINY